MYIARKVDDADPVSEPPLGNAEEWRSEFPELDLIHEIVIRTSDGWSALAEVVSCLRHHHAELISLSARCFGEQAETITCRVRRSEDSSLASAVRRLQSLSAIDCVTVSYHLGRAGRLDRSRQAPAIRLLP
jgi:hypothetical protein